MSFRTCRFVWNAEQQAMLLVPRFRRVAKEQYQDGVEYSLDVHEQRSSKAHAYYMASVNNAWENLRGETAEILSTPKLLRGWALIAANWYDEHLIDVPDKNTAIRMAVFSRSISSKESYSEVKIINHDGTWFVRIRTPRSQSMAAMNKEDFAASSRDVLTVLSGVIEVKRRDLEDAGKRNAV